MPVTEVLQQLGRQDVGKRWLRLLGCRLQVMGSAHTLGTSSYVIMRAGDDESHV